MSLPGVEYSFFLLCVILQSQPGSGWEPIRWHLLHTLTQLSWLLQSWKPWKRPGLKQRALGVCVALTLGFLYAVPRASVLVLEEMKAGYYMTGDTPLVTILVSALGVRSIFPLPPYAHASLRCCLSH